MTSVDLTSLALGYLPFIKVIDDVYTVEECKRLIRLSEYHGYSDEPTNKFGQIVNSPRIRNNRNVNIENGFETHELWSRIKEHIPQYWMDKPVVGLSKSLRFSKYTPDQYFYAHTDTSFYDESNSGSRISVVLYLNDEDLEGGHTRFFSVETMEFIDIVPKAGRVLVFEHEISHAGLSVKQGVKYCLRTDVMYSLGIQNHASVFGNTHVQGSQTGGFFAPGVNKPVVGFD
ncbi:hypothetical protein K7432_014908 [Basidiobolus ranarum]|uniref:Prolyl 4-hydroxylase alpha subunit domain-containing protein n=1 Tax=Basidiobolus ranarum TaxID=34480 RepID=A0ABR2VNW5_9FUNG